MLSSGTITETVTRTAILSFVANKKGYIVKCIMIRQNGNVLTFVTMSYDEFSVLENIVEKKKFFPSQDKASLEYDKQLLMKEV